MRKIDSFPLFYIFAKANGDALTWHVRGPGGRDDYGIYKTAEEADKAADDEELLYKLGA